MKNAAKAPRRKARSGGARTPEGRTTASPWLKVFVWVLLAIFVVTSVGVALVVTAAR